MPAGLPPGAAVLALPVLATLALAVLELAPLTPGIRSCVVVSTARKSVASSAGKRHQVEPPPAGFALFGVDAVSSTVVALIDGKTIAYPDANTIVKAIVACFLIFGFWALFGLALATLFQQSALAIGLGLAYALVVEVLIFGLLGGLGGDIVKQIQQWFPVANTGYLVDSFGSLRVRGAQTTTPFADATHAVLMLLLYVAAFTAISAYLSRSRDITA